MVALGTIKGALGLPRSRHRVRRDKVSSEVGVAAGRLAAKAEKSSARRVARTDVREERQDRVGGPASGVC